MVCLDRLSKNLLVHLNNCTDCPSEAIYLFGEDVDKIAEDFETDSGSILAAVRYLEQQGYLLYGYGASEDPICFSLDHKGLHWREFRREETVRYLQEKWIDCLSLLVSLAALIISAIALWPKTAG